MSNSQFFGKNPPRALKSFGVAGLLNEDCRVYYNNISHPKHIGRVSDLLAAKLQEQKIEELRLRALILYGLFEGYNGSGSHQVAIECGIDEEKVALGFAFMLDSRMDINKSGIEDRINLENVNGEFETMLSYLTLHAHRVVMRFEESKRRVEIVALFGQKGKMSDEVLNAPHLFQFIDLEKLEKEAEAHEYIELGDLDYQTLLKDDSPSKLIKEPVSGQILADSVKTSTPPEAEEKKVVKGKSLFSKALDVIKVKGAKEEVKDETIKISGVTQVQADEAVSVVSSSKDEKKGLTDAQAELYEKKISELQNKIKKLEEELAKKPSLLSKFIGDKGEKSTEAAVPPAVEEEVLDKVSTQLIGDIQDKAFAAPLERAQKEVGEIKKEIESARAKRWVDGLMSEFVQEKALLNEKAQKLNTSMKQKEHEFRNKERVLKEEMRKLEDQLKQKNFAVNRMKDQLTQATAALEKTKTAKASADDAGTKQKLIFTQKLLATSKDENNQLNAKIEEYKNMLAAAQAKTKSTEDVNDLKTKLDRAKKQAEEFKKVNQQLMERLSGGKDGPGESSLADTKKKLESAQKMVAANQKESERLNTKISALEKENLRLKTEHAKAQAENRRLKASAPQAATTPGGTTTGSPSAAKSGTSGSGGKGNPPPTSSAA